MLGRIAGLTLTILVLSVGLTLPEQQPQILFLSMSRPAGPFEGQNLRPQVVTLGSFSVLAENQPPTASLTFTPSRPLKMAPISFNATSSSDPGGSITAYNWDFGDNSTGTGSTIIHTYERSGTFTVRLNVTDDLGAIGSASIPITVKSTNFLPVPIFTVTGLTPSPLDLFAGDVLHFDGSASRDPDTDGDIVSFLWTLGDGSSQAGPVAILHAYSSPGSYPVQLTVTDNSGEEASTEQAVWIHPALALTVSSNSTQGFAPLFISLDAQASGGRYPYTFLWDFGDGRYSSSNRPYHNYTIPGVYRIWATVTDSLGHTATREMSITVNARPVDPTFLGISGTTLKIGGALIGVSTFSLVTYAAVRRRSSHGRHDS